MKTENKKIGIEVLRVVSMICVVLLHSIAPGLRNDFGTVKWDILNILSSFATASVPVFFMISGALILSSEKTYSVEYTLKKRLPRMLLPLIFWSFIAVIKEYYFIWYYNGIKDLWGAFTKFITFPQKEIMVHFWFMYYLIPLYLISPVLKSVVDKCPEKIIKYTGILWGISLISFTILPMLPEFLKPLFNWSLINNIGFINSYLGHFVLGYYLYTKKIKITNRQLEIIIIAMAAISAVVTSFITKRDQAYNEWFKSYKNIVIIILSCVIFLRGIRIEKVPQILSKIILWLSSLSFGIYLMHNIYISVLSSLYVKMLSCTEIANVFLQTLAVSIVIIQIIEWIKKGSRFFLRKK